MSKYRPIYNCPACGNRWRGSIATCLDGMTPEQDAAWRLEMEGTPKCPNLACGKINVPRGMDLSMQQAPGLVGGNIQIKAIDETAKIVMQDYGMTDLRSDVRPGETAAPKLPPQMQEKVDNFFVGGRKRHPGLPNKPTLNPAFLGRAAIAGAYRQPTGYGTVDTLRPDVQPPVRIVADSNRGRG
jgi:hypothetical protein